jgi:hypothetical protein
MTPNDFIASLKKEKKLQVYEYLFELLPDKKVMVTDTKKMTCDVEVYRNPESAYFVYSYTLKQTDASRIHNKRTMDNLNFGENSISLKEYKKELEKCK